MKRLIGIAVAGLGLAVSLTLANPPDDAEKIGSETCALCHDELATAFAANIHQRADPEGSCESCHGAGSAHMEDADPELIRRFGADAETTDVNNACGTCHARDRGHRNWDRADHNEGGLACTSCHAVHEPETKVGLLSRSPPGLCYTCHAEVRAAFLLPEHHPVDQGGVDCTDCHNPHAPGQRRLLGGFKQADCLRCHSEYRGPWFFEHQAVAVEGCTACHSPHGSVNRHLLTYQRVGDLCLQCHPGQPFFHVAVDGSGERTTSLNDCTRCHTQIHGSNNDALFLR